MSNVLLCALLLLPGLLFANFSAQRPGDGPAGQPGTLRTEGPVLRPEEGMPLGNGHLGVLVWGEGRTLRLTLDRAGLWDLRTAAKPRNFLRTYPEMSRILLEGDQVRLAGTFETPEAALAYPAKLPGLRIEIDLAEGLSIGSFLLDLRTGRVHVHVSAATATKSLFVEIHATDPVVRVTGGTAPSAIRIEPLRAAGLLSYPQAAEGSEGETRWIDQAMYGDRRFAAAAHWTTSRADEEVQPAWTSVACTLLMSDAGSRDLRREAVVLARSHADYYRAPEGWGPGWRRFAPQQRPWVRLPDERIQRMYELAAYLYRAGSAPGSPPLPRQGLWSADDGALPALGGAYINSFHAPMAYSAYATGNLIDQGLPWFDWHMALLPVYRRFAGEFFGMPEGCAAIPGAATLNGALPPGHGAHSLSPAHGAWVAWQFFRHWRATADATFLANRAAPFCAGIGRGLLHLLAPSEEASGALRLPLSISPEPCVDSRGPWLPANSNYDQALIQALFTANAHMAEARGDAAGARLWRDALQNLEPLDIADGALTVARGTPYLDSRSFPDHAISIHPLGLIDPSGSDRDAEIAAATLEQILRAGTRTWTGSTFAWFGALSARAGQGDRALDSLDRFLAFTASSGVHLDRVGTDTPSSEPEGRHISVEGNFLAMEAIHEMLLQSHGDVVRIFPAVPGRWLEASFAGLRAQGGFLVSARRSGGRTTEIAVRATTRSTLRMQNPFADSLKNGESLQANISGFDATDPVWETVMTAGQTLSVRIP